MHVCLNVCMCVCMYKCVAHTYTHSHSHTYAKYTHVLMHANEYLHTCITTHKPI